jgi:DNA polymerase V
MAYTRSFGEAITELNDLRSALGSFADSLAVKLRRQGLVAGHISVFVRYRDERAERYGKAVYAERTVAPTSDVFALEAAVQDMAAEIHSPQLRYKKAGVILSSLSSADRYQIPLYAESQTLAKSDSLMQAIDQVNEKTSLHLQSAVALLGSQKWRGKQQKLSPYDHASWQTIPAVY